MAQEHLDTAQLLAIYKEGEMQDVAALEHLASCAECQQSFDDSRWLLVLRRLRGIVEAGPHPSSDELAAYRGHALSSPRIARIERHLRSCDRCLAAYRRDRVVDRKLAYSSPAPSLLKRVQRRFRPRPLRQLGTVLVRQLGEQLGLLFLPAPIDSPTDGSIAELSIPLERSLGLPRLERGRRTDQTAHPASASRRKQRHELSFGDTMDLTPVTAEAGLAKSMSDRRETRCGSDLPPSVRIPADGWEFELTLEQGFVSLRLLSPKKNVPVDGIRVRIAQKGKTQSEAVTDPDGQLHLPLESGGSKITIHTDPPFALNLEFPAES